MKEGGCGCHKVGLAFVWNLDPLSVWCALGDVEGFGGRLGGGLLGILFSCLYFFVCFLNQTWSPFEGREHGHLQP